MRHKSLYCPWLLALALITLASADLSAKIYPKQTAVAKYLKHINIPKTPSKMPTIDQIYVINLDYRPEKWKRVYALFEMCGLKASRVSAFAGSTLSLADKTKLAGNYPIRLSDGEFGCLISHLSVIRHAYNRGYDRVWICEDDIEILEDIKILPSILHELTYYDPEWDIFYTDLESKNVAGELIPSIDGDYRPDGLCYQPHEYYLQKMPITHNVMRIYQRFGLYSYILSRKGMKKILDYFTHTHLWSAIDIDIHYVPGLKEYSATRDLVSIWYKSPFSDIVHTEK